MDLSAIDLDLDRDHGAPAGDRCLAGAGCGDDEVVAVDQRALPWSTACSWARTGWRPTATWRARSAARLICYVGCQLGVVLPNEGLTQAGALRVPALLHQGKCVGTRLSVCIPSMVPPDVPFDPGRCAMDYDEIESLRRRSPAWRLLRADNAPLVLSFLGRVFVEENARSLPVWELASRLDDELYALNERLGPGTYPKSAKAYLDDWAAPETGWLRKYYPEGSDEPHFDATVAIEKSLRWVESVRARSFVGTESRLNIVFELLRQLAFGAETDPDVRLTELHRRRELLDEEIAQVSAGHVEVMDAAAQRDRYQQFSDTARGLLADFREVEGSFRRLDRELREQIAVERLQGRTAGRGPQEPDQHRRFRPG